MNWQADMYVAVQFHRRSKQWKFGLLRGYIAWNAIQLASSMLHSLLKYRGFVTAAFFKVFLRWDQEIFYEVARD